MTSQGRSPFSGTRRRLVLAFDVGTTFSGISYSILDPGQVPEVKGITKFPAQEHISGASKIPTIIYYDQNGEVRAAGAEATREGIFEQAEEGNWVKAEWFKLHLRSKFGTGKNIGHAIPPLPPGKTVVQVFADFLKYMLKCASEFIQDTHINGPSLWNSVKNDIDFVLSHPNGWEGTEQSQMRRAAILAGLVPDIAKGHARLSFVTEGEASLHFAIQSGVFLEAMKTGTGVVVVDAGGGTIDISSYTQSSEANEYEEIAPPQCHFHGSIFVSLHAKHFLEGFLAESDFVDDIQYIVDCFDKTTKPRFRNPNDAQYVKFGSTKDNDSDHNIRFGQLKLLGSDVAKFFEPSIKCVVSSVLEQRTASHTTISHVVLVGGFSANDWMFNQVSALLKKSNLNVLRPENYVNKAVSDGAVSFYLDHVVRSRVSKMVYGTPMCERYDPTDPEHIQRPRDTFKDASGNLLVRGAYGAILLKNIQVLETKEFRREFVTNHHQKAGFKNLSFDIVCYRGADKQPRWLDEDADNFTSLCSISADLSHVPWPFSFNQEGQKYFTAEYEIIIMFGLTEMKAQVAWKVKGNERRGPAKIVYDVVDNSK